MSQIPDFSNVPFAAPSKPIDSGDDANLDDARGH